MQKALEDGKKILIEGCQSFGLSNYHGEYPFVTSRDSTAAAFLSQCGLPPKAADSVVLVLKCFPTRNMVGKGSLLHEQNQEWLATNLPEVIEFGGGSY
jgi:adenylosuccinate synthase